MIGAAAILGAALALLTAASPALAAPPAPERPYSCRLLDDSERKCAFAACDQGEREATAPRVSTRRRATVAVDAGNAG
jgi:hypothetical protein